MLKASAHIYYRLMKGGKKEEKNPEEQGEKRKGRRSEGKKLWSQMVLGSNLFSTTCWL